MDYLNIQKEAVTGTQVNMSRSLHKNYLRKLNYSLSEIIYNVRIKNSRSPNYSLVVTVVVEYLLMKKKSQILRLGKWKDLKDGTHAKYIYYSCSRARDRNCKNKYIREEELIMELLKILDKVDINELGMRQKLEDEIARFNIFQRSVLGSTDKAETRKDTDIRNYAKYILKEGSITEKRELLANLRSKIVYKDKELTLNRID